MRLNELSIALIIPDFDFGGEEKRVLNFANYYVKYFKKVYLIAPEGKSTSFLNSEVIHVKMNVRNFRNIYSVIRLIKDKKIDFLQGHKRATMPYLLLAEKLTSVKSVFNFDNLYLNYNWHCKFVSPKHIVYLSDSLRNYYKDIYRSHINTTINMGGEFLNPVSGDEIDRIKQNLGIEGQFVILSLGRLSAQKNHRLLFKALSQIQNRNLICLVAGTGELEEELKIVVAESDLKDKVRFLGHRTDIQNLLNISDVLVQSSIFEGFPNVFIEAASVGVPIIATNVGSSETLVKNNGILVASGNDTELTSAIEKVIAEHDTFKKEAVALRKSEYLAQFSKDVMLESYVKYYESF